MNTDEHTESLLTALNSEASVSPWVYFVLLFFLIIISAVSSSSETAFFSLKKRDIDGELKDCKYIHLMLKDSKRLLATILITNNLINITFIIVFDKFVNAVIPHGGSYKIDLLLFKINARLLIETLIAGFLILLFGEIIPKIYANNNNIIFTRIMQKPFWILFKIFYPLSSPMKNLSKFLEKKLTNKTFLENKLFSAGQVYSTLKLNEKNINKKEERILQGIAKYTDIEAKDAMTKRMDISSVDFKLEFNELIKSIRLIKHSRVPVYMDSKDNIIGILYIRDLIPYLMHAKKIDWHSLIRTPKIVTENKRLGSLINEFLKEKVHFAIVVDEYGGVSGIISLEDVIEQVVGEINDEFDTLSDNFFVKIESNKYLFQGKTPISKFIRIVCPETPEVINDKKGESETIAGFVLEQLNVLPRKGQILKMENFLMKIKDVERNIIKEIEIKIDN